MNATDGEWFSILVVLLFSAVLALRIEFPVASKRVEMTVLVITTILFFLLCAVFLRR